LVLRLRCAGIRQLDFKFLRSENNWSKMVKTLLSPSIQVSLQRLYSWLLLLQMKSKKQKNGTSETLPTCCKV